MRRRRGEGARSRGGFFVAMLRFAPNGTIHEHPGPNDTIVVCLGGRGGPRWRASRRTSAPPADSVAEGRPAPPLDGGKPDGDPDDRAPRRRSLGLSTPFEGSLRAPDRLSRLCEAHVIELARMLRDAGSDDTAAGSRAATSTRRGCSRSRSRSATNPRRPGRLPRRARRATGDAAPAARMAATRRARVGLTGSWPPC